MVSIERWVRRFLKHHSGIDATISTSTIQRKLSRWDFLCELSVGEKLVAFDCQLVAARRVVGEIGDDEVDDYDRFAFAWYVERQLHGADGVFDRRGALFFPQHCVDAL